MANFVVMNKVEVGGIDEVEADAVYIERQSFIHEYLNLFCISCKFDKEKDREKPRKAEKRKP